MKIKIIIIILVAFGIGMSFSSVSADEHSGIPAWVKGVANFWVQGNITDDEFLEAIEFLINSGTIVIDQAVEEEYFDKPESDVEESTTPDEPEAIQKSDEIEEPTLTEAQEEELEAKLAVIDVEYEKILEYGDDNLTIQQENRLDQLDKKYEEILQSYGYKSPTESDPTTIIPNTTTRVSATCDTSEFNTSNSAILINKIKSLGDECVNELFNAPSNIQVAAFSSNNMIAVAEHVVGLSQAYAGNGDNDVESIFLYLRAGYFVEENNKGIKFNSQVQPAVKTAIDAFVVNSHFYNNNHGHGMVLGEVISTMDSADLQDVYLPVVKEWLSRWNESYAKEETMTAAVNNVFSIIWRGSQNDNFVALVSNDEELVSKLSSFTFKTWMLGTDAEYLLSNAAWQLGELKQYTGASIQPSVDKALRAIFDSSYQLSGYGSIVWLNAANGVTQFGNCADYGICGYVSKLTPTILSQSYTCSDTIKIRSQNLNPTQQTSICSTLHEEEIYFHSIMNTNNVPIPGDMNTQLQINIFDSVENYDQYAGTIFDIDTDNGGMYLEGDPSNAKNIPNFITYEQSDANDPHYVWNLEHEYVHYLDGRFNLFGDEVAPDDAGVKTLWWAEGVAEYVANKNKHIESYNTIHDGSTYDLSTIFNTDTSSADEDRNYSWSYLAVRFMFENHNSDVMSLRDEMRAGDWNAYQVRVNSWANNYGAEFTTWTNSIPNPG